MAYAFSAGSTQYLSAALSVFTNAPITVAVWYRRPATASTIMALTFLGGIPDGTSPQRRRIGLQSTNNNDTTIQANTFGSGTLASATSSGTESLNAYNHAVNRMTATTSRQGILNNAAGSVATTGNLNYDPGAGLRTWYVGVRNDQTLGAYLTGDVSEVAVWTVDLTDDEIASLAKGFKPFRVRPQSLLYYAPLIRNLHDVSAGITLTNNNSATVADHPRVY